MAPTYHPTSLPTTFELTGFLYTFFVPKANDIPFEYHKPLTRSFDASTFRVSSVVLSITPTTGFYTSLQHGTKVGFLHRPFGLDRRSVPRLATILSSHKGFDEALTVGANTALAGRLGLDSSRSAIIQGYKGDAERRIGLVAPFTEPRVNSDRAKVLVLHEFQDQIEGSFGFDELESEPIKAIAIMNAFHPEEVDRAVETAIGLGLLAGSGDTTGLLYLTGAIREAGLDYARSKGIKVICVGHRACEEWGIAYLGDRIRKRFPSLRVEEVYEEEEPRQQLKHAQATSSA
ncbi:Hypothetical predicted protein [Lecanosticta acicola]|uniref:Uncharacterized protein n=1 Tax=Lecanosticta acicola TaxID=111012 RepID=A0AAI8YSN7_9PEZI|nr:Hypothetical predicted protein [Lecanosticta acicola]